MGPQRSSFPVQMKLHSPSMHTGVPVAGAVQVAPQPSQWLVLVFRSTHIPAQTVSPSPQATGPPSDPPGAPPAPPAFAPPVPAPAPPLAALAPLPPEASSPPSPPEAPPLPPSWSSDGSTQTFLDVSHTQPGTQAPCAAQASPERLVSRELVQAAASATPRNERAAFAREARPERSERLCVVTQNFPRTTDQHPCGEQLAVTAGAAEDFALIPNQRKTPPATAIAAPVPVSTRAAVW